MNVLRRNMMCGGAVHGRGVWCCAAALATVLACGVAGAAPMLSAGDSKAERVVLSVANLADAAEVSDTPLMQARTRGVETIRGADLDRLRRAFRAATPEDGTFDASVPLCRLLAVSADGKKKSWYDARVSSHAAVFVRAQSGGPAMVLDVRVDPEAALRLSCIAATPGAPAAELLAGTIIECSAAPSTLRIDQALLKARLFAGTSLTAAPVERDLTTGRIALRPPKGFTPESYCGVLLWINGDDNLTIREQLFAAADEAHLILACQVDAGNGTPVSARLQRVCDTLTTLSEKVHIDPTRIYVGGISGGGKASVLLATAFPEIFAGVLPVVGFGCYEKTQSPDVIGEWPPLFTKPHGQQWNSFRALRFAPMTGGKDFNHAPILASVKVFSRDKLDVQLYDVAGVGHEMPPPAHVREAVEWLDEPRRTALAAREKRAGALMASTDRARDEILKEVLETAPFTPAGWAALRERAGGKGAK